MGLYDDCTLTVKFKSSYDAKDKYTAHGHDLSLAGQQAMPFRGKVACTAENNGYTLSAGKMNSVPKDGRRNGAILWTDSDSQSVTTSKSLGSICIPSSTDGNPYITHLSFSAYIGSTDHIAMDTIGIKIGNISFFQFDKIRYWRIRACQVYHDGEWHRSKNNEKDLRAAEFSNYTLEGDDILGVVEMDVTEANINCGYFLVVQDLDITGLLGPGTYDVTVFMDGAEDDHDSVGGGDWRYLELAVQSLKDYHTETETHVHSTTTTTTVTFPATADGVNIHAVKDGTEHLIPLYTDSDINNSPGKDIQNTVFYLGAANGDKQYKQWMALNGANHPALDPSHLYGYGYDVLGVYLKKGKDFTVEETGTYTETVTVTLPGAG